MVIDRNDLKPAESSGTGVPGRDGFGPEHDYCVNRYVVCFANSKRKFVWFLHVLRAISGIFMIPFVYRNDKQYSF